MPNLQPGGSDLARSFGARIRLGEADRGLFVVLGNRPLQGILQGAGATPLILFERTKALAIMSARTFLMLKGHEAIRLIGPVEVDADRFARFASMIGIDTRNRGI